MDLKEKQENKIKETMEGDLEQKIHYVKDLEAWKIIDHYDVLYFSERATSINPIPHAFIM